MKFKGFKRYISGFTMAEAILVMTILGIIATIMISTLKPARFKDESLKILAKKVINEIDQATSIMLSNHSADGTTGKLRTSSSGDLFSFGEDLEKTLSLYKKYLATTRRSYESDKAPELFKTITNNSSSVKDIAPPTYLKDGALLYLGTGVGYNVSLDNASEITIDNCTYDIPLAAILTVDVNGDEKPNQMYKDQFHLPVGIKGINYEQMCMKPGEVASYDCEAVAEFVINYRDEYSGTTECSGFQEWCNNLGNGWYYVDGNTNDSTGDFCKHPCGNEFKSCQMPRV